MDMPITCLQGIKVGQIDTLGVGCNSKIQNVVRFCLGPHSQTSKVATLGGKLGPYDA